MIFDSPHQMKDFLVSILLFNHHAIELFSPFVISFPVPQRMDEFSGRICEIVFP